MNIFFDATFLHLSPVEWESVCFSTLPRLVKMETHLMETKSDIPFFGGEGKILIQLVSLNESVSFENLIILLVKNAHYESPIKRKQFSF